MTSVHMPNASSLSLQFDQSHELHSDGEIDLSLFNQYLELQRSTFATQVHLRSVIPHFLQLWGRRTGSWQRLQLAS